MIATRTSYYVWHAPQIWASEILTLGMTTSCSFSSIQLPLVYSTTERERCWSSECKRCKSVIPKLVQFGVRSSRSAYQRPNLRCRNPMMRLANCISKKKSLAFTVDSQKLKLKKTHKLHPNREGKGVHQSSHKESKIKSNRIMHLL